MGGSDIVGFETVVNNDTQVKLMVCCAWYIKDVCIFLFVFIFTFCFFMSHSAQIGGSLDEIVGKLPVSMVRESLWVYM